MRNFKSFLSVLAILLLSLFFWCCSSHQKALPRIKKDSPPPPQDMPMLEDSQSQPEGQELSSEEIAPESGESLPGEELSLQEKEDPSVLLEEALFSYQDAQLAWEKGDFETALAALDEAYNLILKLKLSSDSPLLQEKSELRLLIAQRIQEIYASRLTTVGDNHKTIPLEENRHVLAEIKNFQTKERKYFEDAYRRSGLYREIILEELKKAGLPLELSWIPLIESWFKVRAYSRARALGLWQFISSTGYRFGLKRDRWIDERMDPLKSTRAAIKYLEELHSLFGDWTTALASYNCGEIKVQKVIRSQHINYLDNFWDLYLMLPRETARFVPRFIATLLIIKNPEKYGFNLPDPETPLRYETISINRPVRLDSLSKALGLNQDELASLNSELRHKSTPPREYSLKVPPGFGDKTTAAINSLDRWIPPEASYIVHYVRRGETLSRIAQRYRTSVSTIARLNRLRRIHLIRPGQRLKIPVGGGRSYASHRPLKLIQDGEKLVYVVKRGDSLYLIANAFNTTVKKIKRDNNLKGNILHIGQKLVIQSGKPPGAVLYTVRSGDTPFDIAKRFGMNLTTLLRMNGLSTRSKIYPGQQLWVRPK